MASRDLLYQEFGILLASARRRSHLSQAQLGARMGLSRTSVTNIECGRQPVQLHQLYLFASALKTDLSKLLPKESIMSEGLILAKNSDESQILYIEQAKKLIAQQISSEQEGSHVRQNRKQS